MRSEEEIRKKLDEAKMKVEEPKGLNDTSLTWPKKGKIYLFSDKASMYETLSFYPFEIPEEDIKAKYWQYIAHEVSITIRIDQTGEAWATHLNDVPLQYPVEI